MFKENNRKSHREWRKNAKKQRRKLIRQKYAKERDEKLAEEEEENMKNPTYLTRLVEQRALELIKKEADERFASENHEKWLRTELIAQSEFRKLQKKLEEIENEKNKIKLKIREEFEKEQNRIKELKNEKKRIAEEKQKQYDLLMEKINLYITKGGEIPVELTINSDTNPGKPICSFFIKTGACRFGDRCLRNHSRPGISRLLLIPNFFTHIQLDQHKTTEYGGDSLEYDDCDLQNSFADFFEDVTNELESFGQLDQFFVCCNYEPHLRGNVYVEFRNQRDALKTYQKIQGRYYGGKRLNIEFSCIISWATAICGLSFSKQCPKGKSCNFLHIFKNPKNKYPLIERKNVFRSHRDPYIRRQTEVILPQTEEINRGWNENENEISKRNWRWSESPEADENNLLMTSDQQIEPSSERKRKHRSSSKNRDFSEETFNKERKRKSPCSSTKTNKKLILSSTRRSPYRKTYRSFSRSNKNRDSNEKEKSKNKEQKIDSDKVNVKHKRKHKKTRK